MAFLIHFLQMQVYPIIAIIFL